jgi:protein ImuB
MRYLSLWLSHFPTDRWRRNNGAPDRPLVMVATVDNRRLVMAADQQARKRGILVGQSAASALARYPDLIVRESEPQEDHAALHRLALWCLRFSPLVAQDGADGLLLDITGCASYWKGEDRLLELLTAWIGQHYQCRAAIAGTIGAAWALARYGKQASAVVPAAGLRDTLHDLPIAALRIDADLAATMARLGLGRIGDLFPLARASLAARFGQTLIRRLQQALGEESEALVALRPLPAFRVGLSFPEPIGHAEDIDRATRHLLAVLCEKTRMHGLGVRTLRLSCYRLEGDAAEIKVGFAAPSAAPGHLYHVMRERLGEIDPGFGIEQVLLSADEIAPLLAKQGDWEKPENGGKLAELIDRLRVRLGKESVYRWIPVESHIPEKSAQRESPLTSCAVERWAHHPLDRPLRLFPSPEPIEAMAPIPDDPPVHFRWRHRLHRVTAASGPERIEPEWWRWVEGPRKGEAARDYYRIADEEGHVYWLYREGQYGAARAPRWFLHGLFR